MSDLVDVTFIEQTPENSVVAAPDGRVFIDITKLIHDSTMRLAVEKFTLLMMSGDEKKVAEARLSGKAEVLRDFLTAVEGTKAAALLQKEGVEVTKESVMARIEQERRRQEKEIEAKMGKSIDEIDFEEAIFGLGDLT